MKALNTVIIFLALTGSTLSSFSQKDSVIIPLQRQLNHQRIIEAQTAADMLDRKKDGQVNITGNEEINLQITDALFRQVTQMRLEIEKDKRLVSNNDKIRSLRKLQDVVTDFNYAYRARQINAANAPLLIDNFRQILNRHTDSLSMAAQIDEVPYEIGIITSTIFKDNKGYADAKRSLFLKYSALHPEKILQTITPYVNEPFADSLILLACKNNIVSVYNAAQNPSSAAGKLIHRSTNSLVKAVADLSQTPNALLYFPFLDDLLSGKKTMDGIKKYVGDGETGYDSVGYFKLLVQTEIDYSRRIINKDTPLAMFGPNGLRDMLQRKDSLHFITQINELHNESNINIRMRSMDSLSSVDLYYAIVMAENIIYTSSYKHSFNRLIQRLGKKPRTDSLLMMVNFDYFKKFIKMAANFNRLDTFLSLMPADRAGATMQAFVANLDNKNNLEDAVDVADAYSSIENKKLLKSMLQYVKDNEQKSINNNSNRGKIIYGLLNTIFQSADSANKVDLTAAIGIPSIYNVENNYLKDDSGRIVTQVFFYGDEDGKGIFNGFVNSFPKTEYSVKMQPEWVEIKSIKGKKNIWVYANRPLSNDQNLDDTAQVHLGKYLRNLAIYPSIVIHRGHSYWLPRTIDRMPGDAKIVVLGSCGGYKNLNQILDICPDAHIISTKEIGKGDINKPVINYLNQNILAGKTIDWRQMWASLTKVFSKDPNKEVRESWESYVPPYKNLGAIFIKAYNKKMEGE